MKVDKTNDMLHYIKDKWSCKLSRKPKANEVIFSHYFNYFVSFEYYQQIIIAKKNQFDFL